MKKTELLVLFLKQYWRQAFLHHAESLCSKLRYCHGACPRFLWTNGVIRVIIIFVFFKNAKLFRKAGI